MNILNIMTDSNSNTNANAATPASNNDDNNNERIMHTRTYQNLIFATALIAGTAASILSKSLLETHGKLNDHQDGEDEKTEQFAKPLALTLGMFVSLMLVGLPLHLLVVYMKIPFPGYIHIRRSGNAIVVEAPSDDGDETTPLIIPRDGGDLNSVPSWMYLYLGMPGLFDLLATALAMIGLMYVNVSAYQLLRATGIVWSTVLHQNLFAQRYFFFQWIGVVWNVFAIFLVILASVLNACFEPSVSTRATLGGIALLLLSTLVQSLQLVAEEKVMKEDAPRAPPLLLLGMEGLWGTLLCGGILYPIAMWIPGSDHGSLESPHSAWAMLVHTPAIRNMFLLYMVSICLYSLFSLLLTVSLSSTWHNILDNARLPLVWGVDLVIYYFVTKGNYGEPWTGYSWLQLAGLIFLIYGTCIYNAPDTPSIRLEGQWYALGINLAPEYAEIELQRNPAVPGVVKWLGSALGRRLKFG
ncbi:hypothetical protein MPSEU_000265200 [Mayamaea pseudoterrestris]|nr:hypothetical protein MPSEU_000265200 [Mayamaea pseudoterrestris]